MEIEEPDWTLPPDWAPDEASTVFEIDPRPNNRTRIDGIRQVGRDRIPPGDHRFVVIKTESPDNVTDGSFEASVLCSADVNVPPVAAAVNIDVQFGQACTIEVSIEAP